MSRRVAGGRRAFAAIFGREWKIMNRTPIFLLNGVLVSVLLPAMFVLMATIDTGGGGGSGAGGGQGGDTMALLKMLMASDPLLVILGAALFMTICGSINGTASSTFSREGAQFWISQVIPVAPREQAAAKFVHSYLVATLGVVTSAIVAGIFLHVKASQLAAGAGLALVAGVALTAVGMIIDLARPLLDWTNPQKAIKQNLNVLLGLMADAGDPDGGVLRRQSARPGEARAERRAGDRVRRTGGALGRELHHPAQVRRQALSGNFLTGSDLSKLFYQNKIRP